MEELFRCARCAFECVRPFRFLGHLLWHAGQDQLSNCSRCRRKLFSHRHKRLHRLRCLATKKRSGFLEEPKSPKAMSPEEQREVFQCAQCDFRSERRFRFLGHQLCHKAQSQLSRCRRCRRKLFSQRHKRLHKLQCAGTKTKVQKRPKTPKEKLPEKRKRKVVLLRCSRCPYETRQGPYAMANHVRRPKACERNRKMASYTRVEADGEGKFPCSHCSYRGKDLPALNAHLSKPKACERQRKAASYVRVGADQNGMYPCSNCSYRGKNLIALNHHLRAPKACRRQRKIDAYIKVDPGEDGKFPCARCSYRARDLAALNNHRGRPKACQIQSKIDSYIKVDPGEDGKFPCARCSYRARDLAALNNHRGRPKACQIQSKIDSYITSFVHVDADRSGKYPCSKCSYRGKNLVVLNNHMRRPKACQTQKFPCAKCSFEARDLLALTKHCRSTFACVRQQAADRSVKVQRDADGKLPCPGCPFRARDPYTLTKHLEKGTACARRNGLGAPPPGQPQLPCSGCAFRALDGTTLRRHRSSCQAQSEPKVEPDEDGVFACPKCPYRAVERSLLSRHIESGAACARQLLMSQFTKQDEGDGKLACPNCPYRAADPGTLATHLQRRKACHKIRVMSEWAGYREEGGEYPCPRCPYRAQRPQALHKHLSSKVACDLRNKMSEWADYKEEEGEYPCTRCPYRAQNPPTLHRHLQSQVACDRQNKMSEWAGYKEEEGEYPCHRCTYRAPNPYALHLHLTAKVACERRLAMSKTAEYRDESGVFFCPRCPFKARHGSDLLRHLDSNTACQLQLQAEEKAAAGDGSQAAPKRQQNMDDATDPKMNLEKSCRGQGCDFASSQDEEMEAHETRCDAALLKRHEVELFENSGGLCECGYDSLGHGRRKVLAHFYNRAECHIFRAASLAAKSPDAAAQQEGGSPLSCPFCTWSPGSGKSSPLSQIIYHLRVVASCKASVLKEAEIEMVQCDGCGVELSAKWKLEAHVRSTLGCRLIQSGIINQSLVTLYTRSNSTLKTELIKEEQRCSGQGCEFATSNLEDMRSHEDACEAALLKRHEAELFREAGGRCACGYDALGFGRRRVLAHFYSLQECQLNEAAQKLQDEAGAEGCLACPRCAWTPSPGNGTRKGKLIGHLRVRALCRAAVLVSGEKEEIHQCADCEVELSSAWKLVVHANSSLGCRLIRSHIIDESVRSLYTGSKTSVAMTVEQSVTCDSCGETVAFKRLASHSCIRKQMYPASSVTKPIQAATKVASQPLPRCQGLECNFADESEETVKAHETSCQGSLARRHWEELFPDGPSECADCSRPPSFSRLHQLRHFYTPSVCRAARVAGEAVRTRGKAVCPMCDSSLGGDDMEPAASERLVLAHLSQGACMRALATREGSPLECSRCGAEMEGEAKLSRHFDSELGCRLVASGFLDKHEAAGRSVTCDTCSKGLSFKRLFSHPCIGAALGRKPRKKPWMKVESPGRKPEEDNIKTKASLTIIQETSAPTTLTRQQSIKPSEKTEETTEKMSRAENPAKRQALDGGSFDCSGCMRTFKGRQSIVRHHCDKLQPLLLLAQRTLAALLGGGEECPLCRLAFPPSATPAAKLGHLDGPECRRRSVAAGILVESLSSGGSERCDCGFESESAEALALHAASELACEAQRQGLFQAPSQADR